MTDYLGPYELRGELGRGAMAVVWRAWDYNLEREVAIKEPILPHGTDPAVAVELADRFVREGKAIAAMQHSGIITVFDAGVYDGRPALVMELIDGLTLADLMKSKGQLSSSVAVSVASQLLDALGYAHSRGIVHRDVKPDNVFVTSEGRVKLADFGIARMADKTRFTQAGTVMGTPGYMSPEQVRGLPVDARADVFSVGAIMYEMLSGTNPFGASEGIESTSVMYRIVHEDPPPIEGVVPQLAGWLGQVVAVALEKDPEKRYPTAEMMRDDLQAESASLGVRRPPSWNPFVAPKGTTDLTNQSRDEDAAPSSRVVLKLLGILAAVGIVGWLIFAFGASISPPGSSGSAGPPAAPVAGSVTAAQTTPAAQSSKYALVTPGVLTVGSDTAFPPFESMNGAAAEGFDVDLANAIAKEMGLKANFTSQTFDTLIPQLKAGGKFDVVMSGMTITPERNQELTFSESYIDSNQSIVVVKGAFPTIDGDYLSAINDTFRGKRVGIQSGTTGEAWAKTNLKGAKKIVPFDDTRAAFTALNAGKVDAVINDLPVSAYLINTSYTGDEIVAEIRTGEQYGIAIGKSNPELAAAVNEALGRVRASGGYAAIYKKWFGMAPK